MRSLLLVLLLLLPAYSQEIPEDFPKYRTEIKAVVENNKRLTKNFLMIVDQSGSMMGDDITQAFTAFRVISEQPVDEMQLGVIAFGENAARWKGLPKPKAAKPVPPGWAGLPSLDAVKKAHEFLDKVEIDGGGTDLMLALDFLKSEKREDPFDVIVITDGGFDGTTAEIIKKIDNIVKFRKKNKLPDFKLHFYGINVMPGSVYYKGLVALSKKYGTFVNEVRIELEEE